jgi:hypothetical protein
MTSRTIIPMVVLALTLSVSWAPAQSVTGAAGTAESTTPTFPYIGEITGQDVYVRSGAGTAYYFTTKLNAPTRVTVTGHKYRWAEILPPAGSFSWIYKNYVKLDSANPGIGIVTGDTVRVWAGSEGVAPANSSSMQAKLNTGDQVRLLETGGTGDYYKIEPPVGARLYVSLDYVKYVGPVPAVKPVLPPRPGTTAVEPKPIQPAEAKPATPGTTQTKPEPKPAPTEAPVVTADQTDPATESEGTQATEPAQQGTETGETTEGTQEPTPPARDTSKERQLVEQCREIEKQITAELAKPLEQQDYSALRKQLQAITADPAAGNAKVYADYYLSRIEAYELVRSVNEQIQQNDQELAAIRQKVEADLEAKLGQIPNRGRYLIRGRIRPSNIYTAKTGQKRYIILDDTGRIVAYAVPANPIADLSVKSVLDKVVGLVGKVVNDPKNPITLIEFAEVEAITDDGSPRTSAGTAVPSKPPSSGR